MKRSLGMVVWMVGLAVTVASSDPWASAVARDRRREADRHTPDREKGQRARVSRADARAVSRDRAIQGDDPHQQPRGAVEPGVPAERKHHLHRATAWPACASSTPTARCRRHWPAYRRSLRPARKTSACSMSCSIPTSRTTGGYSSASSTTSTTRTPTRASRARASTKKGWR